MSAILCFYEKKALLIILIVRFSKPSRFKLNISSAVYNTLANVILLIKRILVIKHTVKFILEVLLKKNLRKISYKFLF
jgi:hypothetical protein